MIVASYSSTQATLDLLGKATGLVTRKEVIVYGKDGKFIVTVVSNGTRIALDTFSDAAPAINAAKGYL